ncbi:helix-turn-helix domain-containing protein [Conchiformibius steedae]|nr:helix-turn-helix transcriptional regulator [Conchiformibius steedae]
MPYPTISDYLNTVRAMPNDKQRQIQQRIGQAIAKYRRQSGYTQEQIAEMLDIGNEAVSRTERGLIAPTAVRLIELAEILGCSAADLLDEAAPPPDPYARKIHALISRVPPQDREWLFQWLETLVKRLES